MRTNSNQAKEKDFAESIFSFLKQIVSMVVISLAI